MMGRNEEKILFFLKRWNMNLPQIRIGAPFYSKEERFPESLLPNASILH
jgi:hypothetical protein